MAALAAVVLAVSVGLVIYRTLIAVSVGPAWDAFAFLANAADYAGRGFGYTEPQRAPLLSWLTALVFRITGRLDRSAIQWVDCTLTIAGLAAYFALLRRRFTALAASLCVLALVVAPPVWAWIGVGYSDFASVAMMMLALLVLVHGSETSPRWYLLAVPLAMAAVLTRVTALLLVVPLVVWFVLRARLLRDTPYVAAGLAITALAYLPASQLYAERFGDRLFPFIIAAQVAAEQLTGRGFVTAEPGAVPLFLLVLGGVVALTGIAGLLTTAAGRVAGQATGRAAKVAVAVILLGTVILTQLRSGLGVRQAVLALTVPVLFAQFAPRDAEGHVSPRAALDAVMISWLAAAADWFVHNPIQVPRYMIGFLPPLIYLAVLGIKQWTEHLAESPGGSMSAAGARWAVTCVVALAIAVALTNDLAVTPRVADAASVAAEQTALTLGRSSPGVRGAVVYSDVWPYTSWYLKTDARPMPTFEESRAVAHELDKSGARYYFAFGDRALEPTFTPSPDAEDDTLRIWRRNRPAPSGTRRVLYLGHAWDNYLERITKYRFFLDGDSGSQGWEGTALLDAYSADQLGQWPIVAAYDVRWRDRVAAESALGTYVRRGGVLILDASANFSGLAYTLADAGLFDTQIRRLRVPESAPIEIRAALRARHPRLPATIPAIWLDEAGTPWYGAGYRPLRRPEAFEVLASVGGEPLVALQRFGEGRIYWVGSNLVWHAFKSGDPAEAALVSAIFDDAFTVAEEGGAP